MVQPDKPGDDEEITELVYRPRRSTLYSVLLIFVIMCGMIYAGILYTDRVAEENNRRADQQIRESNQQWCDLLVLLDNPIPPDRNNARAVDAAIKLHTLRVNFGC